MRYSPRFLAYTLFVLAVQTASADPVVGGATGIFVNPAPSGSTYTGAGTSHFTYGAGTASSLTFANSSINSMTNTPFKVGSITYFNGATTNPSTSVQLQITLSLSQPTAVTQNFTYGLDLISTPNTGTPDEQADYVRLVALPGQGTFTYLGKLYTLNLTGFQNVVGDGFLVSTATEFHVRENSTASADIFGTVTLAPTAAPGPVAALAFLPGVVAGLRRRRKS